MIIISQSVCILFRVELWFWNIRYLQLHFRFSKWFDTFYWSDHYNRKWPNWKQTYVCKKKGVNEHNSERHHTLHLARQHTYTKINDILRRKFEKIVLKYKFNSYNFEYSVNSVFNHVRDVFFLIFFWRILYHNKAMLRHQTNDALTTKAFNSLVLVFENFHARDVGWVAKSLNDRPFSCKNNCNLHTLNVL